MEALESFGHLGRHDGPDASTAVAACLEDEDEDVSVIAAAEGEEGFHVHEIIDKMHENDITSSIGMHGEMEQRERDIILRQWRSGSSRVLVITGD